MYFYVIIYNFSKIRYFQDTVYIELQPSIYCDFVKFYFTKNKKASININIYNIFRIIFMNILEKNILKILF